MNTIRSTGVCRRTSFVAACLMAALAAITSAGVFAADEPTPAEIAHNIASATKNPMVVEFVVTEGTDPIDFVGPAEVFNNTGVPVTEYIVSDRLEPIKLLGGFVVMPNYTFDTAPPADFIIIGGHVIGTQSRYSPTPKELDWLRARYAQKQTVMSVCTGAYDLAKADLLDNKRATTHHSVFPYFQQTFPSVKIVHGKRYVQSAPRLFTASGLSSGIDLALHIVDMRFGRKAAEETAANLEYQGTGWLTNTSSF